MLPLYVLILFLIFAAIKVLIDYLFKRPGIPEGPYWKQRPVDSFDFKVTDAASPNEDGTSRQELIKSYAKETREFPGSVRVILDLDPSNFVVQNSVKVLTGKSEQLGFVPKSKNKRLLKNLREGYLCIAYIKKVTGGILGRPYGAVITVDFINS